MLDKWQERRDAVLMDLLGDAAFDGWSARTLATACARHEIGPDEQKLLFPRGIADVLNHFSDWADRQMLAAINEQADFAGLKIREKIAFGVMARLAALAPFRGAVQSSLRLLARPDLAGLALKTSWHSADRLWDAAGDTSTDYNRYTKRGLLVAVMSSTTLYWTQDQSDEYQKTEIFLRHRIENVLKLGGMMRRCKPAPRHHAA